jgi:hypothetical protein
MLDKTLSIEWHDGPVTPSSAPISEAAVVSSTETTEPKPGQQVGYISDEEEEEDKERSWKR